MREILFRGKRIDNGEWAYGYYFYDSFYNKAYITAGRYCMEASKRKPNQRIINAFEIDPKTVGQYTGMTDKNGTKIFEGDIIDFLYRSDGDDYGIVQYDVDETEFGFVHNLIYDGLGRYYCSRDIEVIGNIYDNRELLRGEE